jgi:hypothetical protein
MSPAVLVQGSQSVDVKGGSNVTIDAGGQTTVLSPVTVIDGNLHITGNVIIKGSLHVDSDLTVNGVARFNQTLTVAGLIETFNDVKTPKVASHNKHIHSDGSGPQTGPPKG